MTDHKTLKTLITASFRGEGKIARDDYPAYFSEPIKSNLRNGAFPVRYIISPFTSFEKSFSREEDITIDIYVQARVYGREIADFLRQPVAMIGVYRKIPFISRARLNFPYEDTPVELSDIAPTRSVIGR